MGTPRGTSVISFIIFSFSLLLLQSCSLQKQISRSAKEEILQSKALATANVGICIYEPATNKFWYDYQGDHYFTPASNTKLATCYAAMKYLGDSLVGLRYIKADDNYLIATGDPTFLHPDYKKQPVFEFLKTIRHATFIANNRFETTGWGSGWSWNDYEESYQSERSPFPINGNCVRFYMDHRQLQTFPRTSWPIENPQGFDVKFSISRSIGENVFQTVPSNETFTSQTIPFIPDQSVINQILQDTLKNLVINEVVPLLGTLAYNHKTGKTGDYKDSIVTIYSQPTDSLLKPMMHRSDNFFAEQSLLMVSNERLGIMSDDAIIDTLLETDFKDLPQKPNWADGSGLSRYNMFTPQDIVAILNKMKNEFGMERIKVILPTGGEGTIRNYYKAESGYIFGKTGTMTGVVAFSGFLYTKKGKLLLFSTLVNNNIVPATDVRKTIEKFLKGIRNKY